MKDLGLDEDFANLTGSKVGDNLELNKKGKQGENSLKDMEGMEDFENLKNDDEKEGEV